MAAVCYPARHDSLGEQHMELERLKACFRTILSLPKDADCTALKYRDTPSWDSLAHMQLVAEIETVFDIMLDTDEVIGMSDFPTAVAMVKAHDIAIEG
jgi:acyl carrier protein